MKKSNPLKRVSNSRAKSRAKPRPAKDSFLKQPEPIDTKYKALEAKCKKLAQEKNDIEEKYSQLLNSPLMPER